MNGVALVKDFVGEIPRPLYGACIFCARPCYGRACQAHVDLLRKDPYQIARGGKS